MDKAFAVRKAVFVVEQNVPQEMEWDGEDERATHFLAELDGEPVGTARYRTTDKGIKLERFAVLKEHRNKKVGETLVKAVLADLDTTQYIYLNAQDTAINFYQRLGFTGEGDKFMEAGIVHLKMIFSINNEQ